MMIRRVLSFLHAQVVEVIVIDLCGAVAAANKMYCILYPSLAPRCLELGSKQP